MCRGTCPLLTGPASSPVVRHEFGTNKTVKARFWTNKTVKTNKTVINKTNKTVKARFWPDDVRVAARAHC